MCCAISYSLGDAMKLRAGVSSRLYFSTSQPCPFMSSVIDVKLVPIAGTPHEAASIRGMPKPSPLLAFSSMSMPP